MYGVKASEIKHHTISSTENSITNLLNQFDVWCKQNPNAQIVSTNIVLDGLGANKIIVFYNPAPAREVFYESTLAAQTGSPVDVSNKAAEIIGSTPVSAELPPAEPAQVLSDSKTVYEMFVDDVWNAQLTGKISERDEHLTIPHIVIPSAIIGLPYPIILIDRNHVQDAQNLVPVDLSPGSDLQYHKCDHVMGLLHAWYHRNSGMLGTLNIRRQRVGNKNSEYDILNLEFSKGHYLNLLPFRRP